MQYGNKKINRLQYGGKDIVAVYWGGKKIWEKKNETNNQS